MSKEKLKEKIAPHTSNKGITLIALIITIVVMLILVSVTVTFTIGENGILSSAKEAKFKTEVSQLMEEYYINLEAAKMDKNFKEEDLYANNEVGNLKEWIPSIKEKYENKLHIEAGKLCANSAEITEQEAKWLNDLGIEASSVTATATTALWEIDGNTIIKYKGINGDGVVNNGETITIPNKVIDTTTGYIVNIERIGDGINGIFGLQNAINIDINIQDNLIFSEYWSSNNANYHLTYEDIIIGNNVTFEGGEMTSGYNYGTTVVGDNVDLRNLDIDSYWTSITIGDNCKLGHFGYTSVTKIQIGDNATIPDNFCNNNDNLLELTIGKGLVIDRSTEYMGSFCDSVKINSSNALGEPIKFKLKIEGIKSVCTSAFSDGKNCFTKLSDVEIILEENANIGNLAFEGCTGITDLIVPQNASIGLQAFARCTGITNLIIKENAILAGYPFLYCTGLTKITIENGAQIGEGAFDGCTGLKEVVLGNATIPVTAFVNCSSLEKVTIKDGAGTNFAEGLFKDFTTIKTVELGKNITLPRNVFYNTGIENLVINEGTKLGIASFSKCLSLSTIQMKSGTILEGNGVFQNCTALTTVNIEEGVKATESSMRIFSACSALEEITIPNSFGYMNAAMFVNCSNLKTLKISEGENIIRLAATVLNIGCTQVETVEIPSKAVLVYNSFASATIGTIKINKTKAEVESEGLQPWGAKKPNLKIECSDGVIQYDANGNLITN